jgi:hypothetical protein
MDNKIQILASLIDQYNNINDVHGKRRALTQSIVDWIKTNICEECSSEGHLVEHRIMELICGVPITCELDQMIRNTWIFFRETYKPNLQLSDINYQTEWIRSILNNGLSESNKTDCICRFVFTEDLCETKETNILNVFTAAQNVLCLIDNRWTKCLVKHVLDCVCPIPFPHYHADLELLLDSAIDYYSEVLDNWKPYHLVVCAADLDELLIQLNECVSSTGYQSREQIINEFNELEEGEHRDVTLQDGVVVRVLKWVKL